MARVAAVSGVALLAFGGGGAVRAQSEYLDQSFTSADSEYNVGASIGCCGFIAQTFTAARSGVLVGVNIEVESYESIPLHVAIRTVEDGMPTGTVLGETTLGSASAPLDQLITFPAEIAVESGVQYAIVVNYEEAPVANGGVWHGSSGYPGGTLVSNLDGTGWSDNGYGYDMFFRTYVAQPATGAFLPPIDHPAALNIAKWGRVLPVKLHVYVAGTEVTDPTATLTIGTHETSCSSALDTEPVESYATSGMTDGRFRWSTEGYWIANLDTSQLMPGKCYDATVSLAGQSPPVATFLLRATK